MPPRPACNDSMDAGTALLWVSLSEQRLCAAPLEGAAGGRAGGRHASQGRWPWSSSHPPSTHAARPRLAGGTGQTVPALGAPA